MASCGIRVEVLTGDHPNRPDAALALARRWIDQDGLDMICKVNDSAIALAVENLAREKEQDPACLGRRVLRPDRGTMQHAHDPLDLRYLDVRECREPGCDHHPTRDRMYRVAPPPPAISC